MKRVLIVGINYIGTDHSLNGCLNDASNIKSILTDIYKFDEINSILEKDATTENIINGLKTLTSNLNPGDVILFYYSGHGSQLPSKSELDGYQEIICPYDLDWSDKIISDEILKSIFEKVHINISTTVILDCCHSGTGINSESIYSDVMVSDPAISIKVNDDNNQKRLIKFLSPPENIDITGPTVVWMPEQDLNKSALLISACKAEEVAADAYINGMFQGVATAALISGIKNNPNISYLDLIKEMNSFMTIFGFNQHPELGGSSDLFSEQFLSSFDANNTDPILKKQIHDIHPILNTHQNRRTQKVQSSSRSRRICMLLRP